MDFLLKEAVLSALIFLPTAGALLLLLFPQSRPKRAAYFALAVSTAEFLLSLTLWGHFDASRSGFQFVERLEWIPALGISYSLGLDGISLLLVLLTALLTPISLLFSVSHVTKNVRAFSIAFLVLETGMIGSLVALDLALFYVFWEVMLVPMYFIIGIWGGARRIYAAMKFFLFTMAGSLLMFVAILYLAARHRAVTGQWSFLVTDLYGLPIPGGAQTLLFLAFALAFAIKVPLFPFHTWLPDAHTEAPTAGSIILAGVLLKLGVYGYLRFAIPLFPQTALAAAPWVGILGIVGVIYGAFVAYAQKDMKRLIAYSSVSHMGLVVVGIGAFTTTALAGSVLQMVNHGLSTGALFLLVGVLYERRHSREIEDFGGIAGVVPVTTALFLIATLSSIGLPGLNGFVGEFLILLGTWTSPHRWWAVAAATGVILSAVYMLSLVQRVFWNPLEKEENRKLPEIRKSEFLAAAVLVLLMIWIGVRPNDFLDKLGPSIEAVRASVREGTGRAAARAAPTTRKYTGRNTAVAAGRNSVVGAGLAPARSHLPAVGAGLDPARGAAETAP